MTQILDRILDHQWNICAHRQLHLSRQWRRLCEGVQVATGKREGHGFLTATMEVTEETAAEATQVQANGHAKISPDDDILVETGRDLVAIDTLQGRLQEAVNNITNTLNRCTQSYAIHGSNVMGQQDVRNMDALIARSPSEEFAFDVPRDPFLSPYWASDEWLSQLPETKILVS